MQVTFITPDSAEGLAEHYEALRFLSAFVPVDLQYDIREFIADWAGFVTMIYSGSLPVGFFILYPVQGTSKKSVEIHGCYRQDLQLMLGRERARALMDHIFAEIFKGVFMDTRLEKIVAKVGPSAKAAKVWLMKYGFEKVPNTERGKTIWKLERAKYLGIVRI